MPDKNHPWPWHLGALPNLTSLTSMRLFHSLLSLAPAFLFATSAYANPCAIMRENGTSPQQILDAEFAAMAARLKSLRATRP